MSERGAGERLNTNDEAAASLQHHERSTNQPLGSGDIQIRKLHWLVSLDGASTFWAELAVQDRSQSQSSTVKNKK